MEFDIRFAVEILREIEASPHGDLNPANFQSKIDDGERYKYHLLRLEEAGYLNLAKRTVLTFGVIAYPRSLTYAGHDFLEHARTDATVDKVIETAKKEGIALTLETFTSVAKGLANLAIRTAFGL